MARLFEQPQLAYVIFASPKSGTTWLQRLISAHPDALCGESRLFGDYLGSNACGSPHITIQKFVQVLSGYFAPTVPGLSASDDSFYESLLFDWADALATLARVQANKRVYGEKCTPYRGTAHEVMCAFHRYNPNLKFIHLVRDGRDVVVSGAAQYLNQRCLRGSDFERADAEQSLLERRMRAEDFDMFLAQWTEAAAAGLAARECFSVWFQIRYEELRLDVHGWTNRLFRFLELDTDVSIVNACVQAASFQQLSGGRRPGEEDRRSFFRKGTTGDWVHWFQQEHLEAFNRQASNLVSQLGYAIVNDLPFSLVTRSPQGFGANPAPLTHY